MQKTNDLIKQLGALALATRLKRLAEHVSKDVSMIYANHEIGIEARWFLILETLRRNESMSVNEISATLKLSHPAIVQFINQMRQKGLINEEMDANDGRKRLVSLSDKGKEVIVKMKPLLKSIEKANIQWLEEADMNLLVILQQLEQALEKESMLERINNCLKLEKV